LPQPTKAGNTFGGWFLTADGTGTPFTSTTPVVTDIKVYAKWTAAPSGGGGKSKLTITDIPAEAKGSYVLATTNDQTFWGLAEKPASTPTSLKAVEITGSTVEIPLWMNNNGSWAVYEGTESKTVILCIGNSVNAPTTNLPDWGETLTSSSAITFANGSATVEASLFFDDEGGEENPSGPNYETIDGVKYTAPEISNALLIGIGTNASNGLGKAFYIGNTSFHTNPTIGYDSMAGYLLRIGLNWSGKPEWAQAMSTQLDNCKIKKNGELVVSSVLPDYSVPDADRKHFVFWVDCTTK
jgi:uncharacterized repeat protein (TIGR02543 family)